MPRLTHTRRAAFTLAEIVIVLLILGIVGSIGTLRYTDALARFRVERAAQRIAAELEAARFAARSRSVSVTFAFDTTNDRYTITGLPNPNRKAAANVVDLTDNALKVDLSAANFNGDANIVFNGYGMPDSGGVLTVRSGTRQQTVTVVANSGAATVP